MPLISEPLLYWAAAVLVVLASTATEARRMRLDPWTMYLAGLVGLGGAMLGGGLYLSALAPEHAPDGEGRAAIGAFAGAAALGWLVLRARGGNFLHHADASVPGIALGYAVYRIGCFVNGCCFGAPTDWSWGVTFAPRTEAFAFQVAQGLIPPGAVETLSVHPTQLYHAALGLGAFFILSRCKGAHPGSRLALALALYGAGRFAIEFLRGDAQPVIGPLDVNHMASLAMLVMAFALWGALNHARSRPVCSKQTA